MDEEVRVILAPVARDEPSSSDAPRLGSRMAALFASVGLEEPISKWRGWSPCQRLSSLDAAAPRARSCGLARSGGSSPGLRYGAAPHPDATLRRTLEHNLNRLIDELIRERIASLDAAPAQKAALLAAQRKTQGRTVDLRHTLIAGIALDRQAQLATRNLRHFSDPGLILINPFPGTSSE